MSHQAIAENSGPGYAKHPDHKIVLEPSKQQIRILLGGECIADTSKALVMTEGDYPAVYYIPRADIRESLFAKTDHSTYCPFKGHATYWTIDAAGQQSENAAWSYETPYDEVTKIAGHLAFYPGRVDAIKTETE